MVHAQKNWEAILGKASQFFKFLKLVRGLKNAPEVKYTLTTN